MAIPKLLEFDAVSVLAWAGALTRRLNREQRTIDIATVALVPGATRTVVSDQAVELAGEVFLQARDAPSAALTGVFVDVVDDGRFEFEHSVAAGGETFAYLTIGPGTDE